MQTNTSRTAADLTRPVEDPARIVRGNRVVLSAIPAVETDGNIRTTRCNEITSTVTLRKAQALKAAKVASKD